MAIFRMTNIMQTVNISNSPVTPISDLPVTELNFFDTMQLQYSRLARATASSFEISTSESSGRGDYYGRVFTNVTFAGTNITNNATEFRAPTAITGGTVNSFTLYNGIHWNDPLTPQPFGQLIQQQTITVEGLNISATSLDVFDLEDILLRVNFGNDQIYGSNVRDIIEAGTGNDEVWGGDGNDEINGGDGVDTLRGDAGDDYITGGGGNDTIYGGVGNDTLTGQGGNDQIFGDAGDDSLSGEAGDDSLYGGDGIDHIYGGNGNDLLFGGNGSDTLFGGAGNDFLVGGTGNDTLNGGDGDDGIVYNPEDLQANVVGGAGYDTLFIDWAVGGNPLSFNLAAQGFEQAILTRQDTNGESWDILRSIYDNQWRVKVQEFIQDDGSKSIWKRDSDNSQNWSEIRDYYTINGILDFQQTFYDNGNTLFIDFDLTNTEAWSIRRLLTDASGKILSDTYVADPTGKPTNIASTPMKMAALPDGDIL